MLLAQLSRLAFDLWVKAAVLQLLKKIKMIFFKLTVNNDPVMFSGEIYYTDPLIELTKSLSSKTKFFFA